MSGELPKGWAEATLSELGEWKGGGTPDKACVEYWDGGHIPWVSPKDMKQKYICDAEDHITNMAVSKSSTNIIKKDSVVFVVRSGILRHSLPVAVNTTDIAINQDIKALSPNGSVTPKFIMNYIAGNAQNILAECAKSGTTVDSIDFEKLRQYPIKIPPAAEQTRIVEKIDVLYERSRAAREELAHIPKLIERYRQAVLEAAFRGDLTADWRRQVNKKASAFQSTTVGKLLREKPINGISIRGSDSPPGTRALKLSALRGDYIDYSDIRYIPLPSNKIDRLLIRDGDYFITRGNGTLAFVGRGAIAKEPVKPTVFPDTAIRLRFRQDVHTKWFHYAWQSPVVRKQIEHKAKTTAGIWKISQEDIASIEINVPDYDEQLEIVTRVNYMLDGINRLFEQSSKTEALIQRLDQAILDKAFRGELVPQDPNDEPASVLLERIKAARAEAPAPRRGRRAKSAE